MAILNIIDSESIGADELKKLTRASSGIYNTEEGYPIYENDGIKISLRQKIRITFDRNITEDVQDAIAEVQGNTFLNHKTRIMIPEVDDDANTFNYNNYASDAFSYYNLRYEEYENYTTVADERDLPNFLIGAMYNKDQNTEQENIYTMFGSIQQLLDSELLAPGTPINNYEFDGNYVEYDGDPLLENTIDYFRSYYNNKDNLSFQYNNTNKHVFVDYNYNLEDSSQIGNCPFFNRIGLPSKLFLADRSDVIEGKALAGPIVTSMEESFATDLLLKSFKQSDSFMRDFEINGSTTSVKVYDLLDEIGRLGINTNIKQNDELYLRTSDRKHLSEIETPFLFYFYKLLLVGKFRSLIRDKLFDYQKINFSDEHEKEHIGFKVIKRREGRSTPIQTFYFLRKRNLKDFIDTQIRFNAVYTYEVISMYAIYGSSYAYENIRITGGEVVPSIEFDFVNRPSFKVIEVPVTTHTLRVVEPPPLTPEVQFYNERTSKNKLKIRLEHQHGNLVNEFNQKPMRPFGNNQNYIDRLKQYFSSDNVLVQSGKTSSGIYEVYRVDEPPNSYADFEGNLIATVQSSTVFSNGQRSKNVMFVDYIKHQRKYYYMFRVLSHQGNPSETSEIYEIEMYEDADETFLLVNMYNFPDPDYYDNSVSMRKYLQIIPNFEHTIINESSIDPTQPATIAVEELELGLLPTDESLWSFDSKNKYIKLRLESKNSGRKLDLNLLFKIIKPN